MEDRVMGWNWGWVEEKGDEEEEEEEEGGVGGLGEMMLVGSGGVGWMRCAGG